MSAGKSHHHGDLREALIEAGLSLLAEYGPEGLTLRRTAARAGVTHAAPAHHFDGLNGLRDAIAERGFVQFLKALEETKNDDAADDYKRLLKINLAYIKFAEENPGLFHLMFTQVKIGSEALKIAAGKCYMALQECCAHLEHEHDKVAFEFAVWAITHGYAALDMANRRPMNGKVVAPDYAKLLEILVSPPKGKE